VYWISSRYYRQLQKLLRSPFSKIIETVLKSSFKVYLLINWSYFSENRPIIDMLTEIFSIFHQNFNFWPNIRNGNGNHLQYLTFLYQQKPYYNLTCAERIYRMLSKNIARFSVSMSIIGPTYIDSDKNTSKPLCFGNFRIADFTMLLQFIIYIGPRVNYITIATNSNNGK